MRRRTRHIVRGVANCICRFNAKWTNTRQEAGASPLLSPCSACSGALARGLITPDASHAQRTACQTRPCPTTCTLWFWKPQPTVWRPHRCLRSHRWPPSSSAASSTFESETPGGTTGAPCAPWSSRSCSSFTRSPTCPLAQVGHEWASRNGVCALNDSASFTCVSPAEYHLVVPWKPGASRHTCENLIRLTYPPQGLFF